MNVHSCGHALFWSQQSLSLSSLQVGKFSGHTSLGDSLEDVSEPMSMTAIGQNLNMSRDRVRKLLEKGLCALRQESEKIQDYL